jgi:hypothetical protein
MDKRRMLALGILGRSNGSYGPNLVINGNFETNTDGWTAVDSNLSIVADGQVGNFMRITNSIATLGKAYQSITVLPNTKCRVSYYHRNGTGTGTFKVAPTLGGVAYVTDAILNDAGVWVLRTHEFIPTTNTVIIELWVGSSISGRTTGFDEVTLEQIGNFF